MRELLLKCSPKERWRIWRFARRNKCSMKEFVCILERVGVKFPVEMIAVDNEHYPTFTCVSESIKPIEVRLIGDQHFILLTDTDEKFLYEISSLGEVLKHHIVTHQERTLETYYGSMQFTKILRLPNFYLEMVTNINFRNEKQEEWLDHYLLELKTDQIQEIFEQVVELMDVKLLKECINLEIELRTFTRNAKIIFENGHCKNFAFMLENGELYQLYDNGDWIYDDGVVKLQNLEGKEEIRFLGKDNFFNCPKTKILEIERTVKSLFEEIDFD